MIFINDIKNKYNEDKKISLIIHDVEEGSYHVKKKGYKLLTINLWK